MRKTKVEAQKTRQDLLDAALNVFWHTGVTRASLQEIAQEAGVTRGALYWHFKNKEALFEALFEQHYAVILTMLNDKTLQESDDVWGHLHNGFCELLAMIHCNETQRKFCQMMIIKCEQTVHNQILTELSHRYQSIVHRQVVSALELCQKQGKLPENVDIEFSALYLESSLRGLITIWANEPSRFSDFPAMAKRVITASMDVLQKGTFLIVD